MARISIEDLYRGEGGGAKYANGGIMNAAAKEILLHGVPDGYDEQTWVELLLVKHTLATAEKIVNEGGPISAIVDLGPSLSVGR